MEPQFTIEIHIWDVDQLVVHTVGEERPLSFAEAKEIAGSLFIGGFIHKESDVELVSAFTLYGPHQIKKVRLVPRKILS
jgi:hypothetical protein